MTDEQKDQGQDGVGVDPEPIAEGFNKAFKDFPPNSFRLQMPVNAAVFWVGLALAVAIAAFVLMAWKLHLLEKAIPELTMG